MNKNQLTVHCAVETTVTRATADSLVGAALAFDETMVIGASKVPSFNPAKAPCDAVNELQDGTGPVTALRPARVAAAGRTDG